MELVVGGEYGEAALVTFAQGPCKVLACCNVPLGHVMTGAPVESEIFNAIPPVVVVPVCATE